MMPSSEGDMGFWRGRFPTPLWSVHLHVSGVNSEMRLYVLPRQCGAVASAIQDCFSGRGVPGDSGCCLEGQEEGDFSGSLKPKNVKSTCED